MRLTAFHEKEQLENLLNVYYDDMLSLSGKGGAVGRKKAP